MTDYNKYSKLILQGLVTGIGAVIVIKSPNPSTVLGVIWMWGGWFTMLFGLYWMYEQKVEPKEQPTKTETTPK